MAHMPSLRGSPRTGSPLPVYRMGGTNTALPNSLRRAKIRGWQYPLIGGESPGLVHLSKAHDGLKYAGVTEGPFVRRLLDAASLAEERLADSSQMFEPRLLEIPALQIYLLWLRPKQGANIFVSLSERKLVPKLTLESDIGRIISRARRGVAKSRSGRAGKARTRKRSRRN